MIELRNNAGVVLLIKPEDLSVMEYDDKSNCTTLFFKQANMSIGIKGNYYQEIKDGLNPEGVQ